MADDQHSNQGIDRIPIQDSAAVSALEKQFRTFFDKAPSLLFKPWWAIIVGTLIEFTGRSSLQIRSFGLLIVGFWLSMDLWKWLLHKSTRWKFVIGWISTSIILIAVMAVMWWWMKGNLQDIREQALRNIQIDYSIPAGSANNPLGSMFTVTNNSTEVLSPRHRLACQVRQVVANNALITGPTVLQYKNGWAIVGGPLSTIPITAREESVALEPGGDAQTISCLSIFVMGHVMCADVVIIFQDGVFT